MFDRRRARLLPLVLLPLAAAGLVSCATAGRNEALYRGPADSVGMLSRDQLPVSAAIPLPGSGDWIGIGFGSVWVKTPGIVARIDPSSNRVVATVSEATCRGFAMAAGFVWTADCSREQLLAIDPSSNRVAVRIPLRTGSNSEGSIAAGAGSIWVLTDDGQSPGGTLSRVDPVRRQVTARIPVAAGSAGVAFGGGAVWVTQTDSATVLRIDPAAERVTATIPVHASPRFIAADDQGIWALSQSDGTVAHLDPATGSVRTTIPTGCAGFGGDIRVAEGSVWVSSPGKPINRIDPATGRITLRYVGPGGDALNVGFGALWLPAQEDDGNVLWRISLPGLRP